MIYLSKGGLVRRFNGYIVASVLAIFFIAFLYGYRACSKVIINPITYDEFNSKIEYGMTKEEVREILGSPSALQGPSIWMYKELIEYLDKEKKSTVILFFDGTELAEIQIQ